VATSLNDCLCREREEAMTRLSSEQVLKDNNVSDPTSVTTLHLTYKALSDVRFDTLLFYVRFCGYNDQSY